MPCTNEATYVCEKQRSLTVHCFAMRAYVQEIEQLKEKLRAEEEARIVAEEAAHRASLEVAEARAARAGLEEERWALCAADEQQEATTLELSLQLDDATGAVAKEVAQHSVTRADLAEAVELASQSEAVAAGCDSQYPCFACSISFCSKILQDVKRDTYYAQFGRPAARCREQASQDADCRTTVSTLGSRSCSIQGVGACGRRRQGARPRGGGEGKDGRFTAGN